MVSTNDGGLPECQDGALPGYWAAGEVGLVCGGPRHLPGGLGSVLPLVRVLRRHLPLHEVVEVGARAVELGARVAQTTPVLDDHILWLRPVVAKVDVVRGVARELAPAIVVLGLHPPSGCHGLRLVPIVDGVGRVLLHRPPQVDLRLRPHRLPRPIRVPHEVIVVGRVGVHPRIVVDCLLLLPHMLRGDWPHRVLGRVLGDRAWVIMGVDGRVLRGALVHATLACFANTSAALLYKKNPPISRNTRETKQRSYHDSTTRQPLLAIQ